MGRAGKHQIHSGKAGADNNAIPSWKTSPHAKRRGANVSTCSILGLTGNRALEQVGALSSRIAQEDGQIKPARVLHRTKGEQYREASSRLLEARPLLSALMRRYRATVTC